MRLGRNERCWCRSGKKYKRCHLDRDKASPLRRQDALEAFRKVQSNQYCLHPEARPDNCSSEIVQAHTIQRNGGLSRIARDGHVYSCLRHTRSPFAALDVTKRPNVVGLKQASTFTGFCGYHDDVTFAPLEKRPFEGNDEQIFLLAYRVLCLELFLKRADMESTPAKRELDRGLAVEDQRVLQWIVSAHAQGVGKAIDELEALKAVHDEMLLNEDYSSLRSYVVFFDQSPDFLCSGIHQPDIDFRGDRIQRLGNLAKSAEGAHFSMISTDTGSAAVFSWLRRYSLCDGFVSTLDDLPDSAVPHAVVRYAFEYFENTYMSPDWWDSLDDSTHAVLMERQMRELPPEFEFPRPDNCLEDDGVRSVTWTVQSRARTEA